MSSQIEKVKALSVSDNESPVEKGKKIMDQKTGGGKFLTGQKVFHPFYGVGTVVKGNVEKDILGQKTHFSIFRFQSKRLRLMVNTDQDTIISKLVSNDEFSRVMDVLRNESRGGEIEFPKRHSRRYNVIVDKLKSGSLVDVAEVIRDLSRLKEIKKLTVKERNLYNSSKEVFCEALSNVRDISVDEAQEILSGIL